MDRLSYEDGEEIEFELKLENAGTVVMKTPGTPHLADLQPADAGVAFDYYDIRLSLQVAPFMEIGAVHLYGTEETSLLTLEPGQWIRVRGRTNINFNDRLKSRVASQPVLERLNATFILQKVTYIPHPGGSSLSVHNIYPRHLSGPDLPVDLRKAGDKEVAGRQVR